MREIKNEIAMVHPNAIFLASCSNSGKLTYDSIELLGKWLANEIKDFLNEVTDLD